MEAAILLDGGFIKKKFKTAFGRHCEADDIKILAENIISARFNKEACRIYYYDCPPSREKVSLPISNIQSDFSKAKGYKKSIRFLSEVKLLDNFAVREGVLAFKGWKLKPGIYNPDGTLKHSALTDSDFRPDLQQKGVDTKIGLDLAWISYEKICNNVILVTGDSDFVPAIKTARRNGVFVTLYTLNHAIMPLLRENVDILNTTKIDDLINVTNATN